MALNTRATLGALALACLVLCACTSVSAIGINEEGEVSIQRRHLTQACAPCGMQLGTCFQDTSCAQYLGCIGGCASTNTTCTNACIFRFETNPAVRDVNSCIQANGCQGPSVPCACPAPKKKTGTKKTRGNLGALSGTYDLVYGFGQVDCLDYQQERFYKAKDKASSFGATMFIRFPNGTGPSAAFNVTWTRNTTTGAYLASYAIAGFKTYGTNYVLYSDKQHMLLVHCADLGTACFPGGYVLSKRKPAPSKAVYPSSSTIKKLKAALVDSGWAARYDAGFNKWCKLKTVP